MKTLVKTLMACGLTAIFLTATAVTTSAAEKSSVVIAEQSSAPMSFNRILVSGNVHLVVVQRNVEQVEIEGDYTNSTRITRKGYTLIIKSTETEPVIVTVSVKDLQRIDASDKVTVRTAGNFDLKYLQIFLKGDARATVKANAESMYTFVRGNANLKISGSTMDHTVVQDSLSKIDMGQLVAAKTTRTRIDEALAVSVTTK